MRNLMVNFIRRQRLPISALLVIILIYFLLKNMGVTKRGMTSGYTVEIYCNSPHEVDGEEREIVTGLKLVQVQMLIRHGDRAPIDLKALPNTSPVLISCKFKKNNTEFNNLLQNYKNIISKNRFVVKGSKVTDLLEERTFCRGGQLTPYGFLQHLYLGSHLKNKFAAFLESVDVTKDIHVLSTDVPRTKQSAAALLTGMLYQKLLSTEVNIPINVIKDHLNAHLVLNEREEAMDCPALPKAFSALAPKFRAFEKDTRSMLEYIASYLSTDTSKLPAFNQIVDTFFTRACHNLGIASGPKYRLPDSLVKQAYGFSHVYSTIRHSGRVAELQTLSLLSQIAKQITMMLRTEGKGKKLVLYSGHDSMVHPFLQLLDEKFTNWPPYASRIVFEVYTGQTESVHDKYIINKSYFRVIYNGEVVERIKFIGEGEGDLKLFPVSTLFRYLTEKFTSFERFEPEMLSEFLFHRIKSLCKVTDKNI